MSTPSLHFFPRRLLVVSNTPHHIRDGQVVGWGSTVMELDEISTLFDEVVHIAELRPGVGPAVSRAYRTPIRLILLPGRGGTSLWAKLGVLASVPLFCWHFLRALFRADALHLRCPGSMGLVAMLLLPFVPGKKGRWIKFAGNWKPAEPDNFAYRFQRWWLRKPWSRAIVTVNGEWPKQAAHIRAFPNPCLDQKELGHGPAALAAKGPLDPLRIIFVGALQGSKGEQRVVEVVDELTRRGIAVQLDIVGDGAMRPDLEAKIAECKLGKAVTVHGWVDREKLPELYKSSHVILLPSSSEGWPKVLSEAMAFGVIPVSSAVSSIPQYLERFQCGRALAPKDLDGFVAALEGYVKDPELWALEATRAVSAASEFSYSSHVERLRNVFGHAARTTEPS